MRVGVFSCNQHDIDMLTSRNINYGFDLTFYKYPLTTDTVELAKPYDAVSVGTSDIIDAKVLDKLLEYDIHHVALRCVGFNHVDVHYALSLGISVSRIPHYSTASVAEHTLALILALNRHICSAQQRMKENNYDIQGLIGFDLKNATIGIVGTGKIGRAVVTILNGFGCKILCSDPHHHEAIIKLGHKYVSFEELVKRSDIISLHCPLNGDTEHLIDHVAMQNMQPNVMVINTARAGLMNMKAIISGLKSKKIGYLGIDICEMESELAGDDRACETINQETFSRLLTFPNVIVTSHNAFFTQESLQYIADIMLKNLQYYFVGKVCDETFLVE